MAPNDGQIEELSKLRVKQSSQRLCSSQGVAKFSYDAGSGVYVQSAWLGIAILTENPAREVILTVQRPDINS